MKNRRPRFFAVLASLPTLLSLAVVPVIAATVPAVNMNVVDEQDGTPIPGLVALFWGTAREGTITGHGGKHVILFGKIGNKNVRGHGLRSGASRRWSPVVVASGADRPYQG